MVTEYAEGSSLRNYLKEKFHSLNWQDKYGLAQQLSGAINYLYERGIVHKNLHSNSVLIHQDSIKLADFGLSKRIKDASRTSLKFFDTIPYTDPQEINIEEKPSIVLRKDKKIEKYELNEKSDVYSVGVLLWELSSGKKPFAEREYDSNLAKEILQGLREVIVEGTPEKYSDLYSSKLTFMVIGTKKCIIKKIIFLTRLFRVLGW